MSKKARKAPPVTPPAAPQRVVTPERAAPASLEPSGPAVEGLIRFDRRTRWTLGVMTGVFLLLVLLKMHYVSLPMWNTLIPDGSPADRGLVAGTPKQIRMDDYAVAAPWILSNINHDFPTINESLGGEQAPLMVAPTRHLVTLFKPANWGFLIFSPERAYAWMYDLSPYLLLLGSFLFFMLVTGNQYVLSLTGALALLLSSGTVWWSFIPAGMVGYCGLAFVAFVYLLREKTPWRAALWALGLVYAVLAYAFILYPPYQVPLSYLYLLVLAGYLYQQRAQLFPVPALAVKIAGLVGAVALWGGLLYLVYGDLQATIAAVSNTVYPGKRSETGGTGFVANWFSEYYSWLVSDQRFPQTWMNICELSHYLTFAPVILPLSAAWFWLNRRVDWMLAGAAFFTLALVLYIEVGYPEWLAKATLLSMAPTRRAQIPLGIGSIVLTVLYLGTIREQYRAVPLWANALAVAGIIGFMVYTALLNLEDASGLFRAYQLVVPVAFFALMNGLLLFTIPFRYRVTAFCAGLLLFLLPNLQANPLAKGLTPLTDHLFYKAVRQLVEQDPDARWVVNGNQFLTYMVTATGAKQITGVKFIPERKIMRVLDPAARRDSAYNRYAHVTFQSFIDGKDSVILHNPYEDGYLIAADPCSPRLKALNVKYVVYDRQPQPVEVRCMTPVNNLGSITIYKVNP